MCGHNTFNSAAMARAEKVLKDVPSLRSLPPDLICGEFCIIEPGVEIGNGCVLGHHVVLRTGSHLGDNVRIGDFALVGCQPLHHARSRVTSPQPQPGAEIGSGCLLGAYACVYAGAVLEADVLLADCAVVREQSRIGQGSVIGRLATVENRCTIGPGCKVETGAYLCAFSQVGAGCFIAPCVVTSNDNTLGRGGGTQGYCGANLEDGAALGAGCVLLPGRVIGNGATVGAGAVVTKSLPPGEVWVGNPSHKHR